MFFSHRSLYAQKKLCTTVFTDGRFLHRKFSAQKSYAQKVLRTTFFYIQTLLRTHSQFLHREVLLPLLDHLPFMTHRNSWFTYQNHGDFPVLKLLVFHILNINKWWKNFCEWTNINAWYLCYLKFKYGDLFTHISSGLSWWRTNWWGKNSWAWKGSFKDMNFYMIWVKIGILHRKNDWVIDFHHATLSKKVVSTPNPLLDPNFPMQAINCVPHSFKQSYGGESNV